MSTETQALPNRFNLARGCLAENARLRGARTALTVADGAGGETLSMSFTEAEAAVLALAGGFDALGLAPGSRVVIRMGNEVDTILVFFAVIAAGHVAVPTSMMLTPDEARFVVANSEAAAVVLGSEAADETGYGDALVIDAARLAGLKRSAPLADYADTAGEDPAYLVYTSGTTGKPKGVVHAHRVALGRRPMHSHWLDLRETDVVLHAGAFNWTYTIGVGVLDPWVCGAAATLARNVSDPSVWPELIRRHRVTIFAAVPGVYRQILKRGMSDAGALATLRHGVTAGEAFPAALLDEWRERTGREIYEAFGMSEISTFISSCPSVPTKSGSPGKPQPGRTVVALPAEGGETPLRQGETGLLAVRRSDPGLMLGYWKRPDEEATAFRGDWFVAGDLVSFDEDGYMRHHGRDDDVMNALGYRVSPTEVEEAVAAHPSVAEVGVTEWRARADLTLIAAFVVLREGFGPDETGIAETCAARLASYKRPKVLHFVEKLPRSANGKLLRRKLAETVGA
ncbi:acyl-CoA synthetase [Methylopila sp. M107]|uniref:acyl-CoA synthetase n=1 Tax=Methylopila sp. M107 TaxID=1101190 RepID=UPI0003628AE0|nr:acyl-CoA synthetase [Methylopila sp. M107]